MNRPKLLATIISLLVFVCCFENAFAVDPKDLNKETMPEKTMTEVLAEKAAQSAQKTPDDNRSVMVAAIKKLEESGIENKI